MTVKNPDLLPLFAQVRQLLTPYEGPLTPRRDEPGYYDLWSERDIVVDGRRKKGVFFAGLIVQKSYVGFYFMPVYADREVALLFGPELLRALKGKSCFHLNQLTAQTRVQIAEALRHGFELYEERGWV
jgi:hypothetical protein